MTVATTPTDAFPADLAPALALYNEQWTQLEASTDQDDIDRLAKSSFDLLIHLSGLPAPTVALLAAKMGAIVARHADFGTADLTFFGDAHEDACRLASDPASAIPQSSWAAARRAYEVARAAELASEDDEEGARLTDVRDTAEDVLMAIPSPDAAAFAFKHLVAHGDGRETDCWNGMLEAEARRFAGVEA